MMAASAPQHDVLSSLVTAAESFYSQLQRPGAPEHARLAGAARDA